MSSLNRRASRKAILLSEIFGGEEGLDGVDNTRTDSMVLTELVTKLELYREQHKTLSDIHSRKSQQLAKLRRKYTIIQAKFREVTRLMAQGGFDNDRPTFITLLNKAHKNGELLFHIL